MHVLVLFLFLIVGRSTRSSLMLFFSSLAAWYYYFQLILSFSTFNYSHSLSLPLSILFSLSPTRRAWGKEENFLHHLFYYDMIMMKFLYFMRNNDIQQWNETSFIIDSNTLTENCKVHFSGMWIWESYILNT